MVSLPEVSEDGAHGLFGLPTGMIRTSARGHSVFAECTRFQAKVCKNPNLHYLFELRTYH